MTKTVIINNFIMDIVDTRDTLFLWLQSCTTDEQITFFREVVEEYIVNRFMAIEPLLIVLSAKEFLLEQMDIHLTILNQKTIA